MRYVIVQGILLTFLFTHITLAQPLINEVYPRTPEWTEIWNPSGETLNLSQWNISDNSTQNPDTITCNAIENCSLITNAAYFLILGNSTNITSITNQSIIYFYVDDTAIGNGLADSGDELSFYNLSYSSNMSYNSSTSGYSWSHINGSWVNCSMPTPGAANNCTVAQNQTNVKIAINLTSPAIVNATYSGIFNISIEGKSNCSALNNVTISYNATTNGSLVLAENATISLGCNGSTGNWTPNATGEYSLCGFILNSTANNTNTSDDSACANITVVGPTESTCDTAVSIFALDILDFNVSSTLNYNITINDTACNGTAHSVNVTYQIDDLFGNSARSPYTSSISMTCDKVLQRSWSSWPEISGSEAYLVKANISAPGCNDTNSANNYAERMVVLKSNASTMTQSSITITDVSQGSGNTSNWGESFDVELEIYRGDTSQYSVSAYVRYTNGSTKVSEESIVHALEKYTTYEVKVPVRLKSNCDEDYPDGDYTLVVTGLNQSASTTVNIEGTSSSFCQNVTSSSSSSGGGGSGCPTTTTATERTGEDTNFKFVRIPDAVNVSSAFDVVVSVKNNATTAQTFTLYSYVFDGNTLLSQGKSSNGTWQGGWDANSRSVALAANASMNVTLVNRVKVGTDDGTYKLRVKIKDVKDLTKSIAVNTDESVTSELDVSESSESSNADNQTASSASNRTQRRSITGESPIDTVKNAVGAFVQAFSESSKVIATLVIEKIPRSDPTLVPRIANRLWDSFIWTIEQILSPK